MSAIMNSFAVLFTNKVLCGDHPFVCGLINTYEDSKNLYILMNLENGKELFHVLYRNGPDIGDGHGTAALGKEYAQFVVANLVLGIGHVHAHDFVFRDLKPENVMVNRNGYVKLIDFGFAKVIPPGEKSFTLCGTAEYLAPEIVLGTGHNQAVDWWTLGIVAYELRAVRTPFDASDDDEDDDDDDDDESGHGGGATTKEQKIRKRRNQVMSNIVSKKLKFPKGIMTDSAVAWIKSILRRETQLRLGSAEVGGTATVRDAPWLGEMDWDSMLDQTLKPPRLR
jgi:serine/threonine protein kinase